MTMTKEDKQLLLQDLCARLPYGVKVQPSGSASPHKFVGYDKNLVRIDTYQRFELENIKPYLRPMSSMTEEEWNDYKGTWKLIEHDLEDTYEPCIESFDWLNAHHFDYRGLIEKDLAIAVTQENNPYKEKL